MSQSDPASFGELLRQFRLRAGLTQEALAERAGLSVRGLSDLERRARTTPYPDTIRRLSEALDLDRTEQSALAAAASEAAAAQGGSKQAGGGSGAAELGVGDTMASETEGELGDVRISTSEHPWLRAVGPDQLDEEFGAERPPLTLADVAGLDAVKRRLNTAFLAPLRNPELRKMYGKSLRGGLLLFGPPGCGKTFIARATAGELGARFMAVGISDVLDMWLGESERKLHELFQAARRTAPSVLFFDELDALGQRRSQLRQHAGRNVVNQLLAELDGVDQANQGVFVLGATNHLWDVDPALLRPGRFDRMVLVLPPDEPARDAIVRHHLAERPAESVDVTWVARHTPGFSGADLAHLCESAAEIALEDSINAGTPRPMTTPDLRQALKDVRPSTAAWFDSARNYALFANESGVYDDLVAYMRSQKLL